ncbi:MAG: flagellar basal body P-ring formation protein FlgA [Gammaproteobacteria bacterium]|nr:flagellar basal body P-ring formation protein FlgA [Sideroxydans sp.]MBU3904325.1 flagellar basal body P-ring formation protein FlgA [Gammaproteobacteria bacterium]MBU4045071.1 flagellar basal body P-ring formation protein FlgA [Gammaproteobacteria bacterium]MBU4150902.1 flagellar basal body P-ring formation protein FlgA [Gammaproteobacteria bacterium]
MSKQLASLFLLIGCLWGGPVLATSQQSHAAISAAALAFAQAQNKNQSGEVHIKVTDIDRRLKLAACDKLQAFLPAGAKLIGKTSIGVRCVSPADWSVFLQTDIKVTLNLLVASRPLTQGTILGPADFHLQLGELSRSGILTSPEQAIGKSLKFSIGAGQVLRQDMLRAPLLIRQGQTVTLRARGKGFVVSQEGIAMNNAGEGEIVRIRTTSSQVVTGRTMADGSAEVQP